jgi:hypothetical protein
MPTFTPQKPNFYSKSLTGKNTAGLQSVQNAGATNSGSAYSARSTTNRAMPGFSRTGNNGNGTTSTPNILLAGLVNGALAAATSTFIDSAVPTVTYGLGLTGAANNINYTDPSIARLASSGYPVDTMGTGPGTDGSMPEFAYPNPTVLTDTTEDRVIIYDQTQKFISGMSIPVFAPLKNVGGLLFPYTPTISVSHRANYELEGLLHTNYSTPYYTNSTVDSINIQGRFTAQNEEEGQYIMAMIHFLRTVTKMFYGNSSNKGSPPPVLFLDAHGKYMFDHIPVVVREFQYTLPNDVNYITAKIDGKPVKVPTDLNVTIDLIPTYSRQQMSKVFGLNDFASGGLLTKSTGTRTGGWL